MNGFVAFFIVLLFFVLRFAVPLLVIVLLGTLLNRFYGSWEGSESVALKS